MLVMRKIISLSLAVVSVMALAVFASCQKDDEVVTRFDATMEGFSVDGKTEYNVNDGLLYWVPGDQIEIFGTNSNYGTYEYSTEVTGNVIPFNHVNGNAGEPTYRAIYPASSADVQGRLVLPSVQHSPDGSLTGYPMYAEADDTFLEFKNLGGVLKLRLKKQGVMVSSIQLTADRQLSGTFAINYNNGQPILSDVKGSNSVTLSCTTPQDITTAHDFYISVPDRGFEFLQIRIFTADGHVCTKTSYVGINISRSNITSLLLTGEDNLDFSAQAGVLPGRFSVADGRTVRFSSGNMQYTTEGSHAVVSGTADGIWRFAPNQYDFIGLDNQHVGANYKGWIDFFGWGTSGWSGSGARYYQPYSYQGSSGANYGPRSQGNEHYDLTGDYAYADWAVYNAISNGGNQPGLWRTLSKEEWLYLSRREDGNKCGAGTVNGVGGVILIPDTWSQPAGCPTFSAEFSDEQDVWGPNHYTIAEWARMEASGAVFLPASGWRLQSQNSGSNNIVTDVGIIGYYWSSTAHGSLNSVAAEVMSISPEIPGGSDFNFHWSRNAGISIRPVMD